jgi:hypothetical protein
MVGHDGTRHIVLKWCTQNPHAKYELMWKDKKNSYGPCKLVTTRQIIKEKPYKSYKHNIIYFSVFI